MYPEFVIKGHTILSRDFCINIGSGISILALLILYGRAYAKKQEKRGNALIQVVLPVALELLIVFTVGKLLGMVIRGLTYPLADGLLAELEQIKEYPGTHFIGIVLASACLLPLVYTGVFRENAVEKLDIIAFFFSIQHIFNRIGCFLEGCCYGIPMSGPLSIRYPDRVAGYSVFPAELFEAGLMVALLVCQCILYRKGRHLFYFTMAAFGLSILVSECLFDQRGCVMYLGMTAIQIAALILLVIAVWGYWKQRKKLPEGSVK